MSCCRRKNNSFLNKKEKCNHILFNVYSRSTVDALDEEIEKRDVNSKRFLERALERGTIIEQNLMKNKALTGEEAAELVKALMD
jgi:hypothetical protein